jgi:transposase
MYLSSEIKLQMERRVRQTKDLHERLRLCVIFARSEAISPELIAQSHRNSVSSVYQYHLDYEKEDKTRHEPKGGTQSKLSLEQTEELFTHLQEVTFLYTKDICRYVKEKYKIKYSKSGMNHWLKEHDFVYKEPVKVPGKLDPEKQKAFIKYYEQLKVNLPANEEIYFLDAVHPEFQSQAVCGWIKKGEVKTLPTTNKQSRLHFIGALALTDMKVVAREYDTVNSENMIKFFNDLESTCETSKKIHIVCDNGRANKNKLIQEYLKTSKIEIHYLPAYSPNLNAIERLWKIMREKTTYNKCYKNFTDFTEAIRGFFEGIPKITEMLNKRINDSFQSIELNPILLATN